MRNVISILITISSISFAGVKDFGNWTSSSDSAQAVIYDALETSLILDSDLRNPSQNVVQKQNALIVESQTSSLICESKTLGMAMVMSYRCNVTGNISTWTKNSNSVQAVLFDSLSTALQEDSRSRYPSKSIKRKNNSLVVSDGITTVTCRSGTRGMAQVQSYACDIK